MTKMLRKKIENVNIIRSDVRIYVSHLFVVLLLFISILFVASILST